MNDHNRLTHIKTADADKMRMLDALMVSVFVLAACWALFLMDEYLGFHFKRHGMHPRNLEGLAGIITMHFLHADWRHITQNSLGFLVLNSMLFYFYRQIAWRVLLSLLLAAPLIVWLVGRDSNHIGLSLVIYGEFAFLATSGFIRRNPALMRVAFVVIMYYGSLVWYLFPIEPRISFEGHASGFIIGVVAAILWRKLGPQRPVYRFEVEPELPDDENAYWKTPEQRAEEHAGKPSSTVIQYHYKQKDS